MHIPTIKDDVPYLDTEQMIEVDRAMVEDYHSKLIQMMESAGRCLAVLARERFLEDRPDGKHITVMAGSGGDPGNVDRDAPHHTTKHHHIDRSWPGYITNILVKIGSMRCRQNW